MKYIKTISDPVHGTIRLNALQDSLTELPELQRLAWIHHSGLVKVVYPGANHSRLEHAIGVSHLAGEVADAFELEEKEKLTVQAAGLLHDIGHCPFSHSLEHLMPVDHMAYTGELVSGAKKLPVDGAGCIIDVLKEQGVDGKGVADLVTHHSKGILQSIIRGPIDADQLDYLSRDAHYTGVSYGVIGVDRIINTMVPCGDEIGILEKGISSAEELFLAKEHMYATVYYHHTAKIAEQMLVRAVESALDAIPDFYNYTDGELLEALRKANPYAKDMAERLIYRNLLKRAFYITSVDDLDISHLVEKGENAIEQELQEKTGVKKGYVLAHIHRGKSELDETKERKMDVKIIMQNGETRSLKEISGVTRALAEKKTVRDIFAVYCLAKDREALEKATPEILGMA